MMSPKNLPGLDPALSTRRVPPSLRPTRPSNCGQARSHVNPKESTHNPCKQSTVISNMQLDCISTISKFSDPHQPCAAHPSDGMSPIAGQLKKSCQQAMQPIHRVKRNTWGRAVCDVCRFQYFCPWSLGWLRTGAPFEGPCCNRNRDANWPISHQQPAFTTHMFSLWLSQQMNAKLSTPRS